MTSETTAAEARLLDKKRLTLIISQAGDFWPNHTGEAAQVIAGAMLLYDEVTRIAARVDSKRETRMADVAFGALNLRYTPSVRLEQFRASPESYVIAAMRSALAVVQALADELEAEKTSDL